MTDAAALAVLVFVGALLQATFFSTVHVLGGTPDVLLLVLIAIALLRGAVTGAIVGFCGGLLLDVLTLDTLGVTALVLALAGYWTGRYGETTGRERAHAPIISVLVVTIVVLLLGFFLHFLIGEEVSARRALVESMVAGLGLNLLLGAPVFALVRSILRSTRPAEQPLEVKLLG
ncbi:MAG: rod shape-determining protein MreD [Actinobacteria bacterium]|nr:rod shape-determining protein MreD [Actinomycetota bacterium]